MYFIIEVGTYSALDQETKLGYWIIEADGLSEAEEAWVEEYDNSLDGAKFKPVTDFADAESGERSLGFLGFAEQ